MGGGRERGQFSSPNQNNINKNTIGNINAT